MLLDPASYSSPFTSLVLASSVWRISERRQQIQDKETVKPNCLYFKGELDADWDSKLSPSNWPRNELKTGSNLFSVMLQSIFELLTGLYSETAACHYI